MSSFSEIIDLGVNACCLLVGVVAGNLFGMKCGYSQRLSVALGLFATAGLALAIARLFHVSWRLAFSTNGISWASEKFEWLFGITVVCTIYCLVGDLIQKRRSTHVGEQPDIVKEAPNQSKDPTP